MPPRRAWWNRWSDAGSQGHTLTPRGEAMSEPNAKETKGVPWADHNETESTPPDTRREQYGEEPGKEADERAADSGDTGSSATERPSDDDRTEIEHDL